MRLQAVLLSDMKKPRPSGGACCVSRGRGERSALRIPFGRGGILDRLGRSGRRKQVGCGEVLLQGLVRHGKDQKGDSDVGEHVRQIVQQGVEPGAVHSHAEEGLGHVFRPNGGAHHIVHQEAGKAGDQSAGEHAALAAGHQTGQTQDGEGHQVVADDGLPANGEAAVKHELQNAEGEAAQQTGAEAPANGIQHQGDHGQDDAAAPGHLPQLQVAEYLRNGHQHGAFAQGADSHVTLHNNLYLQKQNSRMASHAGVAMRKSENRYDRIPTPALPGSGSRDRTALRHISASLRQRPLDCGTIVARRVEDVKWLVGNGEINSAYERTIIIEVEKRR